MSKRSNRKAAKRDPMKWHEVWRSALKVQETDFRDILNGSGVSRRKALLWIAISGEAGYALLLPVILQRTAAIETTASLRITLLVLGVPFTALITVLTLMFYTVTAQFVASRLGGKGTFTETLYALAAFLAPVFILTALVALLMSFLGGWALLIASFILSMYQLLGCVVAIMTVHDLPLQKAFAACVAIALVLALSLSGTITSLITP